MNLTLDCFARHPGASLRDRKPSALLYPLLASACVLALLLVWLPTAAHAAADPVVYHSPNDDGLRALGTPTTTAGPSFMLHLYMDEDDGTSTASTSDACGSSGDGDERCGWDLAIAASGDVDFVAFTDSGDVVAGLTSGTSPQLLFNGGVPSTGELGVVKLGDLEISSSGAGTVTLTGGIVVTADQGKLSLPSTNLIVVPEPSKTILLVAGVALLRVLMTRKRIREPEPEIR